MKQSEAEVRVFETGLIPVAALERAEDAVPVMRALALGGLPEGPLLRGGVRRLCGSSAAEVIEKECGK